MSRKNNYCKKHTFENEYCSRMDKVFSLTTGLCIFIWSYVAFMDTHSFQMGLPWFLICVSLTALDDNVGKVGFMRTSRFFLAQLGCVGGAVLELFYFQPRKPSAINPETNNKYLPFALYDKCLTPAFRARGQSVADSWCHIVRRSESFVTEILALRILIGFYF